MIAAEDGAEPSDRERLYRLRKTCETGLVVRELAEAEDALENMLLAARVTWRDEERRCERPRPASPFSTRTVTVRSSAQRRSPCPLG